MHGRSNPFVPLAVFVALLGCNNTSPDGAAVETPEPAPVPAEPESDPVSEPASEPEAGPEAEVAASPAEDPPNPHHSLRRGDECFAFDLMTSRSKLPKDQIDALMSWYQTQVRTLERFAVLSPEQQKELLLQSGTMVSGEISQRAADDFVGFTGVKCHITGGILVNASGQIEAILVLDDVTPGTVAVSMQKGVAADSSTEAIQALLTELIAKFDDPANDRVMTKDGPVDRTQTRASK